MVPDWAGYLRFRDAFAAVLDPRLYTIGWLDGEILSGNLLLWVGREAAIVAQIRRYPTGAMDVEGLIAAGDLEEIVRDLIPAGEAWGRSIGCVGAIIESREGWARVLAPHGYRVHQIALRKEL
ncbi:hypothetical protein E2493_06230 [Sphingomonas parva]|uniref:Uncharacterized protein n=1 Tax=Sphingomonas parva TaxID=2555898 RepID=A0A4Y8ZWN5_9SPHN|nr:hypothetical protein [Sphingomonas parva]TFI59119.1 hypothetical protein E2493_06230 [Sphingomonas parva]